MHCLPRVEQKLGATDRQHNSSGRGGWLAGPSLYTLRLASTYICLSLGKEKGLYVVIRSPVPESRHRNRKVTRYGAHCTWASNGRAGFPGAGIEPRASDEREGARE